MSYADAVHVIEPLNYALGITFYSILLFCLLFRTEQNLGSYRHLQIIMVTVDATYTSVQMFIQERMLTVNGLFAMIPTSSFGINREILCVYLAVYNLTFVMIDYSFLYRMWAIKSPSRIHLFSTPSFILLLATIACIECVVWFSAVYFLYPATDWGRRRLHESTLLEYGEDTMNSVLIMGDYFLEDGSLHMIPVYANCVLGSVMSICFGFMIYATYNIIHHLKVAKLISKTAIRMQRQLFITLCLQTIIPLVCLYSPCGLMILLPLLRIDAYYMARATPLLISSFLPLDTLAVLLSTTDYRRDLVRVFTCKCSRSTKKTVVSVAPVFSM